MVDLRKRAGTGHVVGETYMDTYWWQIYTVLAAIPGGEVRVLYADGGIRQHRTQLAYGNDHPISQPCARHYQCIKRAESEGRCLLGRIDCEPCTGPVSIRQVTTTGRNSQVVAAELCVGHVHQKIAEHKLAG